MGEERSLLEFADNAMPMKGGTLATAQRRLAKAPSTWPTGHGVKRGPKLPLNSTSESSSKSKPDSRDRDGRRQRRSGHSPAASSVSSLSRSASAPSVPKHLEPLS